MLSVVEGDTSAQTRQLAKCVRRQLRECSTAVASSRKEFRSMAVYIQLWPRSPVSVPNLSRSVSAVADRVLPCFIGKGITLLGPICGPSDACIECLVRRLAIAWESDASWYPVIIAAATPLTAALAAAVFTHRLVAALGGSALDVRQDALSVEHATLTVRRARLIPVSECETCYASGARRIHRPVDHNPHDRYRTQSGGALLAVLEDRALDPLLGSVRSVSVEQVNGVVTAVASCTPAERNEPVGWGRGWETAQCMAEAIVEALERHAGQQDRRRTESIAASWDTISDRAIHPHALGVPSDEQYELIADHYEPFDPSYPYRWVEATSLTSARTVLLLEECAYFDGRRLRQARRAKKLVLQETSNGCAVGTSLEEASLYGLLEAVERDSILLRWHSRMGGLPVARDDCRDRRISLLCDHIESQFGYCLTITDVTLEHGIPSFAVTAIDRHPCGGRPAALISSAAHIDRERAIWSALKDMVVRFRRIQRRFRNEAAKARNLFQNPAAVQKLNDHSLANAVPEAIERFAPFLNRGVVPPRNIRRVQWSSDMAEAIPDALEFCVRALASCGLETIVLDQSSRELEFAGLKAVKVIVPGLVPLTAGAANARLRGLDRLLTLPQSLGFASRRLEFEQLFLQPHPLD